jgi:MSHA biogenesis protein MshQ
VNSAIVLGRVLRQGSSYRFDTVSDDGVRPWVRHVQVVNNWTDRSCAANTSPSISLTAGQPVPITLEYGKKAGGAATPTIGLNAH